MKFFTVLTVLGIASNINAKQAAGKVYTFTNQNEINNFTKQNNKVVLQVFRPTCPVCIAFKKKGIYPKLAKNITDVGFAMIDIENFPSVEATPTFIFYKDGHEIHRYAGYVEYPQFEQKIRGIFATEQPIKQIKGRLNRPLPTR